MDNNDLKTNILKAIEGGEVKMKPKWQFALRGALFVFGILFITVAVLYVASFIVFTCRQSGACFVPGFGFSQIPQFLESLPWLLLGLAVIFIILLQVLIKHYEFAYGRPLLYSTFGIIALVLTTGVAIGLSPLHQQIEMLEHAKPFYRQFNRPPENVTLGTVNNISQNSFDLHDPRGQIFQVLINRNTQLPKQGLDEGCNVVVLGQRTEGKIQAQAVRRINQLPPPPDGDDRY